MFLVGKLIIIIIIHNQRLFLGPSWTWPALMYICSMQRSNRISKFLMRLDERLKNIIIIIIIITVHEQTIH